MQEGLRRDATGHEVAVQSLPTTTRHVVDREPSCESHFVGESRVVTFLSSEVLTEEGAKKGSHGISVSKYNLNLAFTVIPESSLRHF
jgi:hypothetical protein